MKIIFSSIYSALLLILIMIGTSCSDNNADEIIRSLNVGKITISDFTKANLNETLGRASSLPNEVLSNDSENLNFEINYKFGESTNQYKATLTKNTNNWNIIDFDPKTIKEKIDWNSFTATIVSCNDEYKLINADGKIYPVNCCAYYDKLLANQKTNDINIPGHYSVNSHDNINGTLNINFKHTNSLITINEDDIEIYGWAEKYNTVASIRADLNDINDNNGNEAYLSRPIFSKVNSKWQAIMPKDNTLKQIHIRLANSSLTSDESKWSEEITIQLPANGISLIENSNYQFSLLLSPDKSEIALNGTYNKWNDNEEELITGLEGIHYTLSEEGNKNSTWTILTAKGLEAFSDWVNGKDKDDPSLHLSTNAELGADIYMDKMTKWTPIGCMKDNVRHSYLGTFDGKNYKIYCFKFGGNVDFGLFGSIKGGIIKNITMIDPIVYQNGSNTSFLVGIMWNGIISNCHIIGGEIKVTFNAGPIAATLIDSYVYDCTVTGTIVKGGNQTSGFIGQMENCHILRCGTNAEVITTGEYVGIFAGLCTVKEDKSGSIIGCYAKGKIDQSKAWGERVGGLVGASSGEVQYIACYVAATIIGKGYPGGIIGTSGASSLLSCSYLEQNTEKGNIIGSLIGANFASGRSSYLNMKYTATSSNMPIIGKNKGVDEYIQDLTDENYIKGNKNNIDIEEILEIVSSQDAQKIWDSLMPDKSYISDSNGEKKYNLSGVGENIEGSIWKKTNDGIALWWE